MTTTLQIAGVSSITLGAFLVSVSAGFIVAGVFLLIIGIALGR
jgi:hypothetical protein